MTRVRAAGFSRLTQVGVALAVGVMAVQGLGTFLGLGPSPTVHAQPPAPSQLCVQATAVTGDVIESLPVTISVDPMPSGGSGTIEGDADWCGTYDAGTPVTLEIVDEQLPGRRFAYWKGEGIDDPESLAISVSIPQDTTRHVEATYYTPRPEAPRVAFTGTVIEVIQRISGTLIRVEISKVQQGAFSPGEVVEVQLVGGICPDRDGGARVDRPVQGGDPVRVNGLRLEETVSVKCAPDELIVLDKSSLERFDTNDDCVIGDDELQDAIEQWIDGDISNSRLFEVIDAWIEERNVCENRQTNAAGRFPLVTVGSSASGEAMIFTA